MTLVLKQSTAVDVLIGPFLDLSDGSTAETGESPAVKLSKNGQALAAKSDVTTPVHDADGYYNCELDSTDTGTLGTLVLSVAASGNALPVRHEYQVVRANIYDSIYANAAALQVNTIQIDSVNISTSTAQIGVNVVNAAGTAWGSGAITAGVIAANAIGASELAADAVAEIQSGLSTLDAAGVRTALGSAGDLDARFDAIEDELLVIDNLLDDLPTLLEGIISGSTAAGTLTTTAVTTDLTGYLDDTLIGRVIVFLEGDNKGVPRAITDYTESGGLITFAALPAVPAEGAAFKIV